MPRPVTLAHTTSTDLDDASVGLSGDALDQIRAEFLIRATLAKRSTALDGTVVKITKVAAPAEDEDGELSRPVTVADAFERKIHRRRFDA